MANPKPSFILLIILASTNDLWSVVSHREDDTVREACSVTRYQDLCIHSLASFSKTAKRSPYLWARAAVSVTITETKSAIVYLARQEGHMQGRARTALEDCMECFHDAIDELHESLSELRDLESETFEYQMQNVQTWMSAALTNEDTCLDGFLGRKGRRVKALVARVANVTFFTSNALAMVNKLASSEGGRFNLP